MNTLRFHQVCEACDALLSEPQTTLTTVAVPWLHVVRAHPMFLEQYEGLWSGETLGDRVKRRMRYIASGFRSMLGSLTAGPVPGEVDVGGRAGADILIVSHLLNSGLAGKGEDFYFADLPARLQAAGFRVVVALINYTGLHPGALMEKWNEADVPRIVLGNTLAPAAEWNILRASRYEAGRLLRQSGQASGFAREVARRAATEALGGGVRHALRVGEQLAGLVRRLSPHTLVTTYEGHSWERVAYALARQVAPDLHCIGYQHAGLFNMQHAALRPLASVYNPDTILSAGPAGSDAMRLHASLNETAIDCIGSSRALSAMSADQMTSERTACLVVPEGDPRECALLFGFSLSCARCLPNVRFVWRLHPNTRFEELVRQYPALANPPANIHLSRASLSEDIAHARWVLYRGSTAAIQAVAGGAFPVYLCQDDEIPIDVLYELEGVRGSVCGEDGFVGLVERMDEAERLALLDRAQGYCRRMFSPLDADRLVAIVSAGKPPAAGQGAVS